MIDNNGQRVFMEAPRDYMWEPEPFVMAVKGNDPFAHAHQGTTEGTRDIELLKTAVNHQKQAGQGGSSWGTLSSNNNLT